MVNASCKRCVTSSDGVYVNIALLDDQLNNRGGSDGIEAAGGRIIEQKLGIVDQRARDGDAATHSAGEAGGKEGEGLFQADEAQRVLNALIDFFVRHLLLNQLVAYIVADGERIKERALLKDHAGACAHRNECAFRQAGDGLTEDCHSAGVRLDEAVGGFEQNAFADAGRAEKDACFAGGNGEADVFEDGWAVKKDTVMLRNSRTGAVDCGADSTGDPSGAFITN